MVSNLESRILICTACNEEFVFTVEAQEYFLEKGYSEDPQMCKSCYLSNKRGRRSGANRSQSSSQAPQDASSSSNRK